MRNVVCIGLLAATCAVFTSSCRTPSAGLVFESYEMQVREQSRIVAGFVQIKRYNIVQRNDLLLVQITVENLTPYDVQFEYRFRWKDKDRMVVGDADPVWKPVSLNARGTAELSEIAPHKSAENFTFEIRFHRDSTRWTIRP